jgi:nucleoside-diphosphate-sugar epimerase
MIFLIGGKGLVGSGFSRYFKNRRINFKIITRKNKKNFLGKSCNILIDCNGNGSKRIANINPLFDFSASVKSVVENLNKIKCNKYVYISTIYTYTNLKNKKSTIESKQIYNDNISPYGLNKRIAELYVKELSSNYLIFRLPFIVGPGLKRNSVYDLTHFKKTFYTYNSQINWIHTDTIAKKVCNLLDRNISNQTFNLASKNSISIKKIMDLCKLSKKDIIKTNRTYEKTEINCDKIKKYISLPNSINEANKYISEYI